MIVDVGCGKGRSLNWFVERYPANRIVGIELDPELCAQTARRLRRHENVTIVCGDATALLPPDGTIFYLYNPFDAGVRRGSRSAVLERPAATIVYYNAKFLSRSARTPASRSPRSTTRHSATARRSSRWR